MKRRGLLRLLPILPGAARGVLVLPAAPALPALRSGDIEITGVGFQPQAIFIGYHQTLKSFDAHGFTLDWVTTATGVLTPPILPPDPAK